MGLYSVDGDLIASAECCLTAQQLLQEQTISMQTDACHLESIIKVIESRFRVIWPGKLFYGRKMFSIGPNDGWEFPLRTRPPPPVPTRPPFFKSQEFQCYIMTRRFAFYRGNCLSSFHTLYSLCVILPCPLYAARLISFGIMNAVLR